MLADAQLQLQNAQHSILFLQKEHAKTIEGLHGEIQTLQRKCTGKKLQKYRAFSHQLWPVNNLL